MFLNTAYEKSYIPMNYKSGFCLPLHLASVSYEEMTFMRKYTFFNVYNSRNYEICQDYDV